MFTWSYSSLKEYINCPKQYQEVKVLKNYQKAMTEQILYGNQVHKALENYIKDGTPLAENYKRFQKLMDSLKEIPGEFHPELRMALNFDKKACKWSAPDDGLHFSLAFFSITLHRLTAEYRGVVICSSNFASGWQLNHFLTKCSIYSSVSSFIPRVA